MYARGCSWLGKALFGSMYLIGSENKETALNIPFQDCQTSVLALIASELNTLMPALHRLPNGSKAGPLTIKYVVRGPYFTQYDSVGMNNNPFIVHRVHGLTTGINASTTLTITKIKITMTQCFDLDGCLAAAKFDYRFFFFWSKISKD